MEPRSSDRADRSFGRHHHALLHWLGCAAALWLIAPAPHAADVYKCVDAHGATSFRDTPCPASTKQVKVDAEAQPLIDPNAPRAAVVVRTAKSRTARMAPTRTRTNRRKAKPVASWECRAANGEVFYRHTRCPSSIPGDGVVRANDFEGSPTRRGRHSAWDNVKVRGVKLPRAEACRRMGAASAAGRDGHRRDERVATYDRLMGRDPCTSD